MTYKPVMRLVLILVCLSACPGGEGLSPREGCEQGVATQCERFYACFTSAELAAANFPSSEAACITKLQTERGCSAQTLANACDGNEIYHAPEASECVDEVASLTCSQLRDRTVDLETAAPACGRVCRVE